MVVMVVGCVHRCFHLKSNIGYVRLTCGFEIVRPVADILSSGSEVLSSDAESSSSGTEKIDRMVTVHCHSR